MAAALAGVLGTGCSTSSPAAASSTRSGVPALRGRAGTGAAPGCGKQAGVGSSVARLVIAGRRRLAIVHVPRGYDDRKPTAVVLNLHGSGSDARQQELFSGMDVTADEDGFIAVYPQALIPDGSGFDWNVPAEPLLDGRLPPKGAANDVTFLVDLVDKLSDTYCVDHHEVFATGMSGGGRMVSQLACDAPGTFAAVAPVAGLRYPSRCAARRPVPVIAFHGTADPVDPFGGHGLAYWTYSVPTAARRWASHDRCAASSRSSGNGLALTRFSGCAAGSSVELYAITGEGHEWPGGPTMPRRITAVLGPQSNAIDANATMWAFFKAHPLG